MKLTAIILISTCIVVSGKGFSQRVTVLEKNVSLEKVFKEIHKQTGYYFLYNEAWLQKTKKVSIDVSNVSLKEVLDICFKGQPFTYAIIDNTIVIKQKETVFFSDAAIAPLPIDIFGKVVDKDGVSLPGATVTIKGSNKGVITNEKGEFSLNQIDDVNNTVIVVSFIGYKTQEIAIKGESFITIILEEVVAELEEIEVVATGYQIIPKERATGSFQLINKELYNRTSEPDIITRLNGIATGMLFNEKASSGDILQTMLIRGISTFSANTAPLIVLDNIPYDGDINNINPNDVENITILKDASAASIWGTRAGNGVIVITTKKGTYNQPMQVSFNSNISISQKPDLNYLPYLRSSDFIDAEKELFQLGVYDSEINDMVNFPLLSPVVELLAQVRDGTITETEANKQIDAMRDYNFYDELLKHMYQKPVYQQYALNIRRGIKNINYMLSAGYDKGIGDLTESENRRLTLRSYAALKLFKNFELQTSIQYAENYNSAKNPMRYTQRASGSKSNYYPYVRLVDDEGKPAVLGRDYRLAFTDSAGENRQLNWQYIPLEDKNEVSQEFKSQDILLNLGGTYTITPIFSAELKYQYQKNTSQDQDYYSPESYYARNLINRYAQADGTDLVRPIPLGGILDQSYGDFISHTLRAQFNADKTWNGKHQLTAIAGAEIRENRSSSLSPAITYGYSEDLLDYQPVDFVTVYPLNEGNWGDFPIPNGIGYAASLYRYTSTYANAAYTYDYRYTLTFSGRKDASNLFGVESNQKGTPLWSAGAGWNISKENFYRLNSLPYLKLRLTWGYNGNVVNNQSGKTRIDYRPYSADSPLAHAFVVNPPNPKLRWEKTGILNVAVDFAFKNNFLSGSLEYYDKRSKDIFSFAETDPTTGFYSLQLNNAEINGKGLELLLNTKNLAKPINWETRFLFSYNQSTLVKYFGNIYAPSIAAGDGRLNLVEGYDAYGLFSYKWAGLDPQTGEPRGYVNEEPSKDYSAIVYTEDINDLEYHGSSLPRYFGSVLNTFSWKNFSFSVNITYKLGYYFRRPSIHYGNFISRGIGHNDYVDRWQKPGDEQFTQVPVLAFPANYNGDIFYTNSAVLVEKGDHIRLQDIAFSYTLDKPVQFVQNLKIYMNVRNLGILWRSNKLDLDPDAYTLFSYPSPLVTTIGVNANF